MEKIDLSTNAKKIQDSYERVVRGDTDINYVVYTVSKDSTLQVSDTGNGSLNEFVEHFSDGQVQFGLARVTVPGSDVFKNLLLGWCPDNAPAKSRLSFATNFADVSKILSGYHVQITARDQDDLDVDDFLHRVGAAAGARYSIQTAGSTTTTTTPKPIVAKPTIKPAPKPTPVSSFVPKSTGKPIAPVKSKPVFPPKKIDTNDGWGDEKDVEVRDFDQKPLEDVPSAYKPTKVDIGALRSQKSDTISSTPKPFKPVEKAPEPEPKAAPEPEAEPEEPKSLQDRLQTYKSNDSERLTSLPKPKVSHSVASRYAPAAASPKFGSAPSQPVVPSKINKVVGGISKDFGAEGGKTPAQIWAEKRGKYKTVPADEEPQSASLSQEFEDKVKIEEPEEPEEPAIIKPAFSAPPRRVIPPVVKQEEPEEDPEEEEEPAPVLPSRSLPPPPVRQVQPEPEPEEEEEEEAAPVLPSRSLPPAPAPAAAVVEPKHEPVKESVTATAEYDYVKDDDNEIGFDDGDLIIDIEFTDEEWWTGKHAKSGEVGLFPAAYVKLNENGTKHAEPEPVPEPVPQPKAEPEPTPKSEPVASKPSAVAEYDYDRDEDNEIEFKEGDLIVEIEFVDDDWWSGKHSNSGEVGLFPANYVKLNE
ncbi:putative actin-binding protein [Scheffersomyces amazonensis]|uniref:putative actin-binding protein n=1 Tax=Scheffersomyces amazonensis TaxID=1078765 RepID=UPI00315D9B3C